MVETAENPAASLISILKVKIAENPATLIMIMPQNKLMLLGSD